MLQFISFISTRFEIKTTTKFDVNFKKMYCKKTHGQIVKNI